MITKKSLQNLNGLLMLSAIAKYQSKRKAAEATNSSIDTVNKYISNLEQVLGIPLVVNNNKGTHLTKRALLILDQIENVQALLDQIYNQCHSHNKYEGNVCICLPLIVSTVLSPFSFSVFCEEYPDINLILLTTLGSPDYQDLGVDFGIITHPPKKSKDFSLLYQKKISCNFFTTSKYIEKHGLPKDIKDLLENHHIINCLQNEHYISGWKEFIAKAQKVSFSTNSSFAVAEAIRGNVGIGLMPKQFKYPSLICLDNINADLQINLYLIVNNCTKELPRVKLVTDYYKAALDRI